LHCEKGHLLQHVPHTALCDFLVVVGSCDLPVARISLFTDRVETSHELGYVFRVAELLESIGQRSDARFLILLAGRSRIAIDRVNHLSGDRASLEVNSRQAET
jgi:hypothetical protein